MVYNPLVHNVQNQVDSFTSENTTVGVDSCLGAVDLMSSGSSLSFPLADHYDNSSRNPLGYHDVSETHFEIESSPCGADSVITHGAPHSDLNNVVPSGADLIIPDVHYNESSSDSDDGILDDVPEFFSTEDNQKNHFHLAKRTKQYLKNMVHRESIV